MHMFRVALALATLAVLDGAPARAQTPPSDAAKAMVGTWELSNADHDRLCSVTFKLNPAGAFYGIELDPSCAEQFPATRDIVSWSFGKRDMLLLNDARGQPILELLEAEAGTYEGLRPNEGRYVLQNAAVVAASRDRTADQMFGEWTFVRGAGRPICTVTLANVAATTDSFAVDVKGGCDPIITRFNPSGWKMDRGQLVLISGRGDYWRFEESEPNTWRRVPEQRPPMLLVKQ
jgi:hypothetical protein